MQTDRHVIFGTAGHVDHGKSSLVLALTGTDPDRLAEEKARQMTIDIGFAFLSLPGLEHPAAIVDVPGHEMFVKNMVAGVTGIDAVIFVVAADEGVQPQTVEHLEVIRSLGVATGVIALTKSDRAAPDRIAEATQQTRGLVKGTCLEDAPIVPVSSVTRDGLDKLVAELARIAASVKTRTSEGVFRLPIDRVFTLKGVGTVVTGTVISGTLQTGDTVSALPRGMDLRVRNLQVHSQSVDRLFAGQRGAVNLADVAKEDLERGDVLATPGSLAPSTMVNARLYLSSRAPRPLEQRTRVRIHHQTREVMARLVLLEKDRLQPGESALVQLRLEAPLVALAGDPVVMRTYSPMLVIGGGSIVDPHPPKRKRAAGAEDVARRETSDASEIVAETLDKAGAKGIDFGGLRVVSGLPDSDLRAILESFASDSRACAGRHDLWFGAAAIHDMQAAIAARLAKLHAEEPLRRFVSLNALTAGAAPLPDHRECFRVALETLRERGTVAASGERVGMAGREPQWSGRLAAARDALLREIGKAGLAAPSPQELATLAGLTPHECKRVLDALIESGDLRSLADGIYILPEVFAKSRQAVQDFLARNKTMNIGQARDLLGASRKYLLPLLEEFDRQGLTQRQGDNRVLRDADR